MCDYSLTNVKSRPAKVGDKLTVRDFGTGTRGFAPQNLKTGDIIEAVCLLPGTEIAFDNPIAVQTTGMFPWKTADLKANVAIFRQINKEKIAAHHDALELPSGQTILLTLLAESQNATVLQLPKTPTTEKEAEEQKRVAAVG